MKKISYGLIALSLLLCSVTTASAQISIGIGLPNLSIGINLPIYPELVRVPGYPVYYAPRLDGNYFFYDGMYWVFQDDNWYASTWYNGPWGIVEPYAVPLYILRIPVSYYRHPPVYFRGWQANAPPRWGQHWGPGWERQRKGWNNWKRGSAPAPAPLPVYQRKYTGDRYPRVDQQRTIHNQQYGYQPRDKAVRQHLNRPVESRPSAPAQQRKQEAAPGRNPQQPEMQHSAPGRSPQQPEIQHSAPPKPAPQQRGPSARDQNPPHQMQQEQQAPRQQNRGEAPNDRGRQEQRGEEERGQGRGR